MDITTIGLRKISKWTFDTSSGEGLSVGIVAAASGMVRLKDTHDAGHDLQFKSVGGSFSLAKKLLPIKFSKGFSGSLSTESLPSYGWVFITTSCKKDELELEDFKGPSVIVDAGTGITKTKVFGVGGSCYLLGLDPWAFAAMLAAAPMVGTNLAAQIACMKTAKAVLFTTGMSAGRFTGAGVASSLGYFY